MKEVVRIVSIKEVKANDNTCLSPLRYLKQCHRCGLFKKAKGTVDEKLKLKCNPQIEEKYLKLLREKEKLLTRLKEINRELRSWCYDN